MIYSVIPTDIIFYDETQLQQRHIKLYNDLTLEMRGRTIERVISTNPQNYLKYSSLLGTELKM